MLPTTGKAYYQLKKPRCLGSFFNFLLNTKHHVLANIRVFRTFTNDECFIFIKHASLRISLFRSLFDLNDDIDEKQLECQLSFLNKLSFTHQLQQFSNS